MIANQIGLYKNIFLVLVGLVAQSCAHRTEAAFEKKIQIWQGREAKHLIEAHGYPNQTHISPDGHKVYEYKSTRHYIEGGHFYSSRTYRMFNHPRQIYAYSCVVWFEIREKKIFSIKWKGNDCLDYEKDEE